MLQELVSEERTFKKPLMGNVLDLNIEARPDFILLDRKPNVIIEVGGMETEKYLNNLRKKEQTYKENGCSLHGLAAIQKQISKFKMGK